MQHAALRGVMLRRTGTQLARDCKKPGSRFCEAARRALHRARDTRPFPGIPHMPPPDDSYLRHQRQRWLRPDAHLWIRPEAARWVKPGTDPADIYPTLARKPDAAQAAAFEAEIDAGYQLLAVLREEVAELRAELKRRRLEE